MEVKELHSIRLNKANGEYFKNYMPPDLYNRLGLPTVLALGAVEDNTSIEIEKSKADELYFIDIVADDIDFMPQLKILSSETNAPILIATSNPDNEEHHEALRNGADFYGEYCETTEQNIKGVISFINSLNRRAIKPVQAIELIFYSNILISPTHRHVFVDNKEAGLTKTEFDVLYYLMNNRGCVLTFEQIYNYVWNDENEEVAHTAVKNTIQRIRHKIDINSNIIENVRGVGYRLPTNYER
jgi:DNA-binding response OmpR family regulator